MCVLDGIFLVSPKPPGSNEHHGADDKEIPDFETSRTMAALEGKAALGFAKLPPDFLFEDLPNDRSDPLWTEIRSEYNLSLAELSALKNARCQGKPN
jgi:hypothetical protein